jgi:dihydropteroate synthase
MSLAAQPVRPNAVKVMGVINTTPDSFSDGGRFADLDAALAQARKLIAQGADLLDIGGESTRPGAQSVPEALEIERVVPLIQAIRAESAIPVSIDTMKPAVARAAVAAGATMWNDVTALRHAPDSLATAAELGCEVVLMHMQGEPRTMQAEPHYDDVVAEVAAFLGERAQAAMAAGVARDRIWLDPGVGFGKHMIRHNLPLLAGLEAIVALGFPVLLGISRKSFISAVDGGNLPADGRLGGSIAGALWGAQAGVAAVRVHDVRETVQALRMWAAIEAARA